MSIIITENIEFENFKGLFSKIDNNEYGKIEFDEAFPRFYYVKNENEVSYATQKENGLLVDSENITNFRGIFSNNDFSEVEEENKQIFAQRSYVEKPQTLINALNNCNSTQLDEIKTILGII